MQLVKQAGLVLRDVKAIQAVVDRGEHQRVLEWTIAEAGPALIKTGLLTPAELDPTLHEMQQAAADDESLSSCRGCCR